MTPEQILKADSETVRELVARLEGYDKFYRFCGGLMLGAEVRPEFEERRGYSSVPPYDSSLDAIWPLQEKTIEKVGADAFCRALGAAQSGVLLPYTEGRPWHIIGERLAERITASALDRARACLIARCSELESEKPVKVQSAEGGGK
jgi:hypothetical protein